jgi:hypothetical protein
MLATKGTGRPEGYPGPICTLYALASLGTLAAEVKRVLLRLFTRLGVDHELSYRHPAIVAGTRTLILMVMVLSRWVRMGCARLLCGHEDVPSWSGPRELVTPRGHFYVGMYCLTSLTSTQGILYTTFKVNVEV